MNHQSWKEKIACFHDPELPESERREIAEHLSACEECTGLLKQWKNLRTSFKTVSLPQSSGFFVNAVMGRLADLESPREAEPAKPSVLNWLLPAIGYAFAFCLMFVAISQREAPINTSAVLLSDVPQSSQWTFSAEPPDVGGLVENQ